MDSSCLQAFLTQKEIRAATEILGAFERRWLFARRLEAIDFLVELPAPRADLLGKLGHRADRGADVCDTRW